ncbi:MAG: cyanophycinase [Clostridium sp.]
MEQLTDGNLIIIGGAEDKEGRKTILKRACDHINRESDILLVATIATEYPSEAAKKYKKAFSELDVKNIKILNIEKREDAYSENNINLIKEARLIFFTGGDQLRITSLIGGTPIYDELIKTYKDGKFIVGTSAGASVMSDTMIIGGEDEESPKKSTLSMSPGLGLINNVIIDQHFDQRGRIGRLLSGVAQNPEVLGIGIDENTAIFVNSEGIVEVVGEGVVYFIDGSQITYTNVSEQHTDEVLSMYNVKLHVLKNGNKFSLLNKSPYEEETKKDENIKRKNI